MHDRETSCYRDGIAIGRIAAEHGSFTLIRQVAPICTAHLIHGSRGFTRVNTPNGISIGSAVFAALTVVSDTQTDRPRYLRTCV